MNQKNGKSKRIIMVLAIVIMLSLAVIIGIHLYHVPAKRLAERLDLGQKYLLEEDYKQAIVEFEYVLEIDPRNEDAYFGIADAYTGMEDIDKAITILEQGYELIGSEKIQKRLIELRNSIEEIKNVEAEEQIAEEADKQEEEELPYYELEFSPEDFTLGGYSIMEGDHFEDIARAVAERMPKGEEVWEDDNYTGWYYNTENSGWFPEEGECILIEYSENGFPVTIRGAVEYFAGDYINLYIGGGGMMEGLSDIVSEYPFYEGKVTPYKYSYEDTIDILGIREIIEQAKLEEKFVDEFGLEWDYSVFSFESQYGNTECIWDGGWVSCRIITEEWEFAVSFSDGVLDAMEILTIENI